MFFLFFHLHHNWEIIFLSNFTYHRNAFFFIIMPHEVFFKRFFVVCNYFLFLIDSFDKMCYDMKNDAYL